MSTSRSVGILGAQQRERLEQRCVVLVRPAAGRVQEQVLARPEVRLELGRVDAERRDDDPLGLDAERRDDPGLRELADRHDDVGAASRSVVEPAPVGALRAAEQTGQVAVLDVEQRDDDRGRRRGAGNRRREWVVDDGCVCPGRANRAPAHRRLDEGREPGARRRPAARRRGTTRSGTPCENPAPIAAT